MSPREAKLYELLYSRRADPVSPTISDICRELENKSRSSVWAQLQMLEKAGYISIDRRGGGRRNIIRLTSKRPPGFGHVMEGYMIQTRSGVLLVNSFTKLPGAARVPVTLTIEEKRP
jgi:biotin operon repressor